MHVYILILEGLQALLHLVMAAAKASSALRTATSSNLSVPLLEKGLLGAAACAACNHKDVSTNGLSCLSVIVGRACR